MINIDTIKGKLNTEIIGSNLIFFQSLESTNKRLFELADSGAQEGTVLISDTQTGGRGRLERTWFSPPGVNLYLSVLLRPEVSLQNSAVFTFIASLALVDTIENLNLSPKIKWPNDILIENRKVAGVLTEMKYDGDSLEYIIIGIGLNINLKKESIDENLSDIADKVTSLGIEKGKDLDREAVTTKLINNIDMFYKKFIHEGINSIVAAWTLKWGMLNEHVSINVDNEVISGTARKVDNSGFIYIEDENGKLNKIITGDMLV